MITLANVVEELLVKHFFFKYSPAIRGTLLGTISLVATDDSRVPPQLPLECSSASCIAVARLCEAEMGRSLVVSVEDLDAAGG